MTMPSNPLGHKLVPAPPPQPAVRQSRTVSMRLVLIVTLIVLGIAPVLFFALKFIPDAERKIIDSTREQHLAAAQPLTTMLANGIAQQDSILRQIAAQFAIYNESPDRRVKIQDLIEHHALDRAVSEAMPYLMYLAEEGATFHAALSEREGPGRGPKMQEALDQMRARSSRNSSGSMIVMTGAESWRVLLMPVRSVGSNRTEAMQGAMIGVFSMNEIRGALSSQFQRGGATFSVVQKSGEVIFSGGSASGSVGVTLADDPLFTSFLQGGELPKGIAGKRIDRRSATGEKRKLIATFVPHSNDMGVLVFSDEAFIFTETTRMRKMAYLMGGAIALIAIILGFILGQIILSPISHLIEATRQIAEGNFAAQVPRSGFSELNELAGNFTHMTSEVQRLIEELQGAAKKNKNLFLGTVRAIADALDAKDPYTRGHSERVSRYAKIIAIEHGLDAQAVDDCEVSALLHDIGKVGVEDAILRKPAALTEEEFEIMKNHPGRGSQILGTIAEMKPVIAGVRHHHERWTGGGYPDNLAGEKIEIQARIVSVADTLDAMTTERPYQKAMSMAVSAARINQLAGKSFDPKVIETFNRAYQKGILNFGAEKKLIIPKNKPQVA